MGSRRFPITARLSSAKLRSFAVALVIAHATVAPPTARADFPLDPSQFTDPSKLIDLNTVRPIISAVGNAVVHRAYQPATPLGTNVGFDFGVQATAVKLPESFNAALKAAGASGVNIPILPIPKLNLHKGMGDWLDIGGSTIFYKTYKVYGFDAKIPFYQPEEGPVWAFRMSYTTSSFKYSSNGATLSLSTRTFRPEILFSKQLEFADPYVGAGYQMTRGTLGISIPIPSIPIENLPPGITIPTGVYQPTPVTATSNTFVAFMGVGMRIPHLGLKITIDGEYSKIGSHALGAMVGFSF